MIDSDIILLLEKFYCSYLETEVILTLERKTHVRTYHPDVQKHTGKIREVLLSPDQIRESKYDEDAILFYKFYPEIKGGKYVSVVVKKGARNVILTCYLTDRIKGGALLWKKD